MPINLDSTCEFVWGFGQYFLLKEVGVCKDPAYYVWSDPDYSGNNEIIRFEGNPDNFTHEGFCGRYKGIHSIRGYCGENVKFNLDKVFKCP